MFGRKSRFPEPQTTQEDSFVRITGYAEYCKTKHPKRALLSYVPQPIVNHLNGLPTTKFSNEGIAQAWARVLNELGYIVDIISWDDISFTPVNQYDMLVLHGGVNFSSIYPKLPNKPPVIHFLTGTYWKFNNTAAAKRLADFEARHHVAIEQERPVDPREEEVNEIANGIIILGNQIILDTFSKYKTVKNINLASFPDSHFDNTNKDYKNARRNFLFHAGAGNIHKGLDLVLDSFATLTDEHLYVANYIQPEIQKVYAEVFKRPNIHAIGEVNLRSPEFYEAMDTCGYLILPSCSEGQSGAVIETMNQGLVPIVSSYCGVTVDGFGMTLEGCSVEEIIRTVKIAASIDPDALQAIATKTHMIAKEDYTPDIFRYQLMAAIKAII